MDNNEYKINWKEIISFVLFCIALQLYQSNINIIHIITKFIILGLLIVWFDDYLKLISSTIKLTKKIRNKKYFFVTEKGYISDIIKRRMLSKKFCIIVYIMSLIISIFIIFIKPNIIKNIFFNYIYIILLLIASFSIIVFFKNYLTNFLYYLIPWIIVIETIKYENIKLIIIFLTIALISYSILTLLWPIYSLRKISSKTWLFGFLVTFLVTIVFEYIFKFYINEKVQSELFFNYYLVELLEQQTLPSEVVRFLKDNPNLLNKFEKILISYELNEIYSKISLIRFLILSSYSIGKIVIDLKIKLGELKAKDIYNKIRKSENVQYSDLRDCIFYGGKEYEDKIFTNTSFESIISKKESNFKKCDEATYFKIINKLGDSLLNFFKKFI
ncbi:hypothetical protein VJJ74_07060 [Parvimonas micra]|uniref:hypothetical protein n=1 Tax=Parvimonas micra TaxID=33033 RepID=UPI002B478F19|nr:hypothetical protein [Parvimonas micra]MEB3060901.1 hypothetical protein [Parvimonas micra]MEB3066526.1 hypothetical protein [Parvimonas micra]